MPRGNPDRIESASASKYGGYSLAGLSRLTSESHQSVHGGYDATYANEDPNRVLPLDALRELEHEGRFGRLHDTYFATVGNATSVRQAVRFRSRDRIISGQRGRASRDSDIDLRNLYSLRGNDGQRI